MGVVSIDSREPDIISDMLNTLSTLQSSDDIGVNVFTSIMQVDDVDSFIQIDDVLMASQKTDAGIVIGDSDETEGSDDTELAVHKVDLSIVIRFYQPRNPGQDESIATLRARKYASLVRDALRKDMSRGGQANLISFNGEIINGTNLDGSMRLLARKPNNMFYAVVVPVVVGYSIFRSQTTENTVVNASVFLASSFQVSAFASGVVEAAAKIDVRFDAVPGDRRYVLADASVASVFDFVA